MKRWAVLGLATTLFFLIELCGRVFALSPEEERVAKLVEGAKQEREFLMYTSLNVDSADAMLKGFEKKYPFIKTNSYKSKSEKILTRYVAEANAKRYVADVFAITSIVLDELKKKGLIAEYVSPESKIFPEGMKDPEGYWTSLFNQLEVVTYNTKLIARKDLPKNYEEFLEPKWKGKIGLDQREYVWFTAQLKIMGREKGLDFMRKLAQQDLNLRDSKTLLIQLCAAGEIPIVATAFLHEAEKLKRLGAPIEWIAFSPIVTGLNLVGIAKHSPHPNASQLFIDYVLSKEGQMDMARFGRTVARPDIESIPPLAVLKKMKLFPMYPGVFDNYGESIKLFDAIFRKGH